MSSRSPKSTSKAENEFERLNTFDFLKGNLLSIIFEMRLSRSFSCFYTSNSTAFFSAAIFAS
jgi:hypothetical protein